MQTDQIHSASYHSPIHTSPIHTSPIHVLPDCEYLSTQLEASRIQTAELSNHELHLKVQRLANERKLGVFILQHLREIDRRQIWAAMAYGSLFDYCVKCLGYSESQAYRKTRAIRLIKDLPEVENKLTTGLLNPTTAAIAQNFFEKSAKLRKEKISIEEKQAIISTIENKPQQEVLRQLASICPEAVKQDRIRITSGDQVLIQYQSTIELVDKLKHLRALLAHSLPSNCDHAELLNKICDLAISKIQPSPRQSKNQKRVEEDDSVENGVVLNEAELTGSDLKVTDQKDVEVAHSKTALRQNAASYRQAIPEKLKREIWTRCGGRCCFVDPDTKLRCESQFALQIDHIRPVGMGGLNEPENLRLLCRAHNQFMASRSFGTEKMHVYRKRRA